MIICPIASRRDTRCAPGIPVLGRAHPCAAATTITTTTTTTTPCTLVQHNSSSTQSLQMCTLHYIDMLCSYYYSIQLSNPRSCFAGGTLAMCSVTADTNTISHTRASGPSQSPLMRLFPLLVHHSILGNGLCFIPRLPYSARFPPRNLPLIWLLRR